ncbi:MAG: phenylalanine--tRNA ligase subunit beta [Flavobacteriales bacterium]|nr:phenylalanine--tRNA ligase subunit beta [Flavobacteriales bacterium]
MRISLNWLQQYIKLDLEIQQISEYLTDTGLEVEGYEEIENIKGGLKGVVIGEVLTCIQHPNADRLKLTTVNIGAEDNLQIVCGAPNVKLGQKVPVATIGTILYNGDEPFKIKKSKIRGEISEGMICGEDELGLGDVTDGIMVLPSEVEVGTLASDYFNIENDTVFEIGLTPNRSDAMGHIGVARDLKTVLNYNGSELEMCLPTVKNFKVDNSNLSISVEVENSELCPRYSGVSISGVKISASPDWLQNRLKSIGLEPINNIVDITNYVLHETGQPLHAFDANKIKGNKVVVKTSKDKTKFKTLDEEKRELSSEDLMIYNEKEVMCIAGVFGGSGSGVSDNTTNIFLESAYFNPVSVRKTAKRHGLSTDSSFRFERGCDPNITIYALKRAALLIQEIAGGDISSEIVDVYPNQINHFEVELTFNKLDSLIGEKIERESVKSILTDLEIDIVSETKNGLSLRVPPFRADVQREVDVIEEILRIYGFNTVKIPTKLNTSISHSEGVNPESVRNTISDLLSSNGFNEAMNNSLTKSEYTALIPEIDPSFDVKILNPLSQDLDVMRQSLKFAGLENIAYNQNRKNADIKFYEFGKTYHKMEEGYKENHHLQILVSGKINSENWNTNSDKADYFYIKEKVEHILRRLGITKLKSETISTHGFSEGLMYMFKKKRLVCFGKLDKKLCKAFGVKSDVYAADFDWNLILELAGYSKIKYTEVSRFPSVKRDLSLLIDKKVTFKELLQIAKKTEKNILKSVNLFDVYEGDKLPEGKKSYALSFVLEDKTKTLTDKYIDKVMSKLISSYEEKVGAEVRSK